MALTALCLTAMSLLASPASAAHVALQDVAGDAVNRGPDITRVWVRNLDHAVVIKVRFVETVRGDVIVSIDPRKATGLRLVSEYRPAGDSRTAVLASAFSDRSVPEHSGRLPCKGFRVDWSADSPVVRMRMPSRCLHGGDYGAIRFAVLTERGGDADYAPETRSGVTDWIARG